MLTGYIFYFVRKIKYQKNCTFKTDIFLSELLRYGSLRWRLIKKVIYLNKVLVVSKFVAVICHTNILMKRPLY